METPSIKTKGPVSYKKHSKKVYDAEKTDALVPAGAGFWMEKKAVPSGTFGEAKVLSDSLSDGEWVKHSLVHDRSLVHSSDYKDVLREVAKKLSPRGWTSLVSPSVGKGVKSSHRGDEEVSEDSADKWVKKSCCRDGELV